MIELSLYQFKSLMANVKAVIKENPGPENITIREKASKIVYSLEEIQKILNLWQNLLMNLLIKFIFKTIL